MNGLSGNLLCGGVAVLMAFAGAAFSRWEQRTSGDAAKYDSSSNFRSTRAGVPGADSAVEESSRRRQAALRILARYSADPYLTMTDEEMADLVAALDLDREETWQRLNGVLNVKLRAKLWLAAFRAHLHDLPISRLIEIARHAQLYSLTELNAAIHERIHADDPGFLETPEGKSYFSRTLSCSIRPGMSLQDAMQVIPRSYGFDDSFIDRMQQAWMWAGHNNGDGFKQLAAYYAGADGGPRPRLIFGASLQTAWDQSAGKEDRAQLLSALTQLPPQSRREALTEVAVSGSTTAADLVAVMGVMGSFPAQQQAVDRWLKDYGKAGHTRESLQQALAASADPQIQRIAEQIANTPADGDSPGE